MGWIKRNMFWFEHHRLYIEPTEEEKMISMTQYGKIKRKLGFLMATNAILNMNQQRRD